MWRGIERKESVGVREGRLTERRRGKRKTKKLTIVGEKLPDAEERVKGPGLCVDSAYARVQGV